MANKCVNHGKSSPYAVPDQLFPNNDDLLQNHKNFHNRASQQLFVFIPEELILTLFFSLSFVLVAAAASRLLSFPFQPRIAIDDGNA